MRNKIYRYISLSCVVTVLLVSLLITSVIFSIFNAKMREDVAQTVAEYEFMLNNNEVDNIMLLNSINSKIFRFTLIGTKGEVLFDNFSDTKENHANRPEIISANECGVGENIRYSDTLQKQTYYYAILLEDGTVFRVAQTQDSAFSSIKESIPYIMLLILIVLLGSLYTSRKLTEKIIEPINNIDVIKPRSNHTYEELTPLLVRIDKQNIQLKNQVERIANMRNELSEIMAHMNEGLIVTNSLAEVISINNSALDILEKKNGAFIGKNILELNRSETFVALKNAIVNRDRVELNLFRDEKVYKVMLSNVDLSGSIIMIFDVTKSYSMQTLRREFSANVSHELKTPLQAIMGYAELLKSGMVKDEDSNAFAEKIYNQSVHMHKLIQQIIKLSQLDEQSEQLMIGEKQLIDIYKIAVEVADSLYEVALARGIKIKVDGCSACISGVEMLMRECIYNLVDNAIKYNKDNGTIDIVVSNKEQIELIVKDSGIGIPKDEHERVFERFYQVDKSRSKNKDSTGLGLSIVRRAISIHNAKLELKSEIGKGTEFKLIFFSKIS